MTAVAPAPERPKTANQERAELLADALIEDADFLIRHGVTHFDAPRRLGVSTWEALRKRLASYGRSDIGDAFVRNTYANFTDEGLRALGLTTTE